MTVPGFLDNARAATAGTAVEEVLLLGEELEADPAGFVAPAIDPDSVATLLYSSGTTGVAKGVEMSHRGLVANLVQLQVTLGFGAEDTVVAVAPFFHTLGFTVLMCLPLAHGSTVVSLPRFELEAFLGAIERHRATATIVVLPIALALARHPAVDYYDLSSLRFLGCGAAPMSLSSSANAPSASAAPSTRATG